MVHRFRRRTNRQHKKLADLRARAEAGDASAQFNLGDFYAAGQYVEAVACYRLAAEQGHAEAQFRLGAMYTRGLLGVPQNETEAGLPDSRRRVASEAEMKTV